MGKHPKVRSKTPLSKTKLIIFSILPTLFLMLFLEGGFRIFGWAVPAIQSLPLPGEYEGLFQIDEDLFWALSPNLDILFEGKPVRTNRLGLRSPEITPKQTGEFRILSLGESSTFGTGVANEETYSFQLEKNLQETDWNRPYRVINAGVPAYSSFQSLVYLKEKGLDLKPDLILFYHEINDYFPSSLRDSSNNEIGITRSDPQLYQLRKGTFSSRLASLSAIYRYFLLQKAKRNIEKIQGGFVINPVMNIGLPDIGLHPRLVSQGENGLRFSGLNEKALPSRVLPKERLEILQNLRSIARENNIHLLILHPSYKDSDPHDCLLTRFTKKEEVPMFEAHNVLHPPGADPQTLFVDSWHPNPLGHQRLAEGLSQMILHEINRQ